MSSQPSAEGATPLDPAEFADKPSSGTAKDPGTTPDDGATSNSTTTTSSGLGWSPTTRSGVGCYSEGGPSER